jgi:hypothetical protein
MTLDSPRAVRIAAAWLRRQAQQQEAREERAVRELLRLRQRVAGQPRDAQGRWTEARTSWPA